MAEAGVRVRVAACITDGDRILLVQHAKEGRRYWLLPGGGVEVGETLAAATAREVEEETGLDVEVGRLVLLCEVIQPGGRHLLNLVFASRILSGSLRAGGGVVVDAAWIERGALAERDLRPPVAGVLEQCWSEGFAGPLKVLGDVWREEPSA